MICKLSSKTINNVRFFAQNNIRISQGKLHSNSSFLSKACIPNTFEKMDALELKLGNLSSSPYVNAVQPLKLIICGPSGVGKDSVIAKLRECRKDVKLVVTATSRAPRPGEVHGVDYEFMSRSDFEHLRDADGLIEWALVYGEYKGVPRRQVDGALAAGSNALFRVDVQGAATLRRLMPEVVSIFISAPSEAALVARLVARGTESDENLVLRVAAARKEHARLQEFDYVVVNEDGPSGLDDCVQAISKIIDAEKLRTSRRHIKQ
uniref:guanylate kinase n=1 Tax=Polytomella parva TaxID=51329 RepID=A0A7S0V5G3_9CHLO|mmetsp:Transcript_3089/g.5065  ORF Transcript_3089/g.5065 Transcript_3089/m.5065 type:complete len:264 (+) Transcript_3089:75-866(+)